MSKITAPASERQSVGALGGADERSPPAAGADPFIPARGMTGQPLPRSGQPRRDHARSHQFLPESYKKGFGPKPGPPHTRMPKRANVFP